VPVAALMRQLGYDVPAGEVEGRLRRLDARRAVLLGLRDGEIAGWVGVCVDEDVVAGLCGFIEGFVVDEAVRGEGIGERLLESAETWVRARGASLLRVQSNVVRERAHAFYERHGFEKVKAQYQLRKAL